MEYNGKEDTEQMTEHPVPAEERSGRIDHFKWSTDNRQMLIAECQTEERNVDTELTLIHEFKPRTLKERFLWNKTGRKKKQNTAGRKKFRDHETRKGHNGI